MKLPLLVILLGWNAAAGAPAWEVDPPVIRLDGPDATVQLVVTERAADGQLSDVTHHPQIQYETLDAAVAVVDSFGRVQATAVGTTRIRVTSHSGISEFVDVTYPQHNQRPVRFSTEIVPIFLKLGCNAGACHGKSSGQNGFRLSLLGFDPTLDYESVTREARGRRIFPAAPRESLVLRKPTARMPHGGGKRLDANSAEFRALERWIGQGAPFDATSEPTLIDLEARPAARIVTPGGSQQVRVVARLSDGSETDVTRLADYRSTDPDMLTVDAQGCVVTRDSVGEAAVVARFGGRIATVRISVPRAGVQRSQSPRSSTNLVDRFVDAELAKLGLEPSPPCDDATFARRSSLDIRGLLPTVAEVLALENDQRPDKRARWIARLCDQPEYADRQATIWSALLRNQRTLGDLSKPGTFAFFDWLRAAFAENRPYDAIVRDLLTATGDGALNPPVVWYRQGTTAEEKTDDVAQLFLGVRLQCARCHHHPFERWSPADYEGFATFFRRIGRKAGPDPVTPRVFVLPMDETVRSDQSPRFLGANASVPIAAAADPRAALAAWLRMPDNPFFARVLVNRTWKRFFGRGLVEPEDDLRASNPASVPALLDALASDFVASAFDLKHLTRLLISSKTYARSSVPFHGNNTDRLGMARLRLAGLPPRSCSTRSIRFAKRPRPSMACRAARARGSSPTKASIRPAGFSTRSAGLDVKPFANASVPPRQVSRKACTC